MKKIILLFTLLFLGGFMMAQSTEMKGGQDIETKRVVEAFLEQLGKKDPEKIADNFAETIDWYIFESPKFPWTGRRTKREEVAVVFKTLFSYFVENKDIFQLDSFMVDGNNAAIFAQLGRQFKHSGNDFLMYIAIHFKVEDGKITKFYLYEQTPILEKAYEKKKKK
jgi:ketosteroid isomerase-like protein